MKPRQLSGFYKRGSTWRFGVRRRDKETGILVDITGMTARSMFRAESVDGTVLLTLNSTNGLTIPTPDNGTMEFEMLPDQTVLFPVATKVYFDVELTTTATGIVDWQSPTYFIIADQEVTRDV